MSLRRLLAGLVCLARGHDPYSIATVTHLNAPPGVQVWTRGPGTICRRCDVSLEDEGEDED